MNLRKIEASSYREALAKVRAVYGDDALIVGTRTFQRGGVLGLGGKQVVEVYVTDTKKRLEALRAARSEAKNSKKVSEEARAPRRFLPEENACKGRVLEEDFSDRISEIAGALEELRGQVQRLLRRSEGPPWGHLVLEDAYALLRDLDVEENLAREILSRLDRQLLPSEKSLEESALRGLLVVHIARYIEEVSGRGSPGNTVRVFVGPTGVGKTTTIAKLAARERYVLGKRVALVTLDTFRIAAVDQLRKYADIIGLELEVATDPPSFREAVDRLTGYDVIFVDSAGRSPADEMRIGELEAFVKAVPEAQVTLVLSVTAGPKTLKRAVEKFRRLNFSNLILTKVDETQSRGVVLTAVKEAGKPVIAITNGQNVPDDLEEVDPQRLADLILSSR